MELSARNQLKGTVKTVKSGAVMAEITVNVDAWPGHRGDHRLVPRAPEPE